MDKNQLKIFIEIMQNYALEKGITEFYGEAQEDGRLGIYGIEKIYYDEIDEESFYNVLHGSMKNELELKKRLIPYVKYSNIKKMIDSIEAHKLNTLPDYLDFLEKMLEKNKPLWSQNKQLDRAVYYRLLKNNKEIKKLKRRFFGHIDEKRPISIIQKQISCTRYEINNEIFYDVLNSTVTPDEFSNAFEIFFKYINPLQHLQCNKLIKDKLDQGYLFTAIDFENQLLMDNYIKNMPRIFSEIYGQIDLDKLKENAKNIDRQEQEKLANLICTLFNKVKIEYLLSEKELPYRTNKI